MPRYRGVLFDLFGTLIHFDLTRLPELVVGEQCVRTTIGGLAGMLGECCPGVGVSEFWQALVGASEEMARTRAYEHVELPSRERFRRALERVGCDEGVLPEAAALLSRAHMEQIADATTFPPEHAALLTALRPGFRLGVVSNFDDTATAYDILHRHGILSQVDGVVVSEALGLRKPHPALLRAGLRRIDVPAAEVLFVGDTFRDDVGGARAAGIDAAWIDVAGKGVPPGESAPRYVVRTLPELAAILTP